VLEDNNSSQLKEGAFVSRENVTTKAVTASLSWANTAFGGSSVGDIVAGERLDGANVLGEIDVGDVVDGERLEGAHEVGARLVGARLDGERVGEQLVGEKEGALVVGIDVVGVQEGESVRGEHVGVIVAGDCVRGDDVGEEVIGDRVGATVMLCPWLNTSTSQSDRDAFVLFLIMVTTSPETEGQET